MDRPCLVCSNPPSSIWDLLPLVGKDLVPMALTGMMVHTSHTDPLPYVIHASTTSLNNRRCDGRAPCQIHTMHVKHLGNHIHTAAPGHQIVLPFLRLMYQHLDYRLSHIMLHITGVRPGLSLLKCHLMRTTSTDLPQSMASNEMQCSPGHYNSTEIYWVSSTTREDSSNKVVQ